MKKAKKESIPLDILTTSLAIFLYVGLPAVFGFMFLFVDIGWWFYLLLGVIFFAGSGALIYQGGAVRGRKAFRYFKRRSESKYAEYMAFEVYKSFILVIPFVVIILLSALLGALISGIGGGVFRMIAMFFLSGPSLITRAAGLLPDMRMTWGAFGIIIAGAFIYAGVYCLGYIRTGNRLKRAEAGMIKEMKSFDF